MFCGKCGQPIQQQTFCSACGAPTGLAPQPMAPPAGFSFDAAAAGASKLQRHLQTVGILWIAYAGYNGLQWMLAYTFLRGFFHSHAWFMAAPGFMGGASFGAPWWMSVITVVVIGRSILSLIAGIALVTRQPWARTFVVVVAFLTLIKLFVGTALAIYTLWALLGSSADYEYRRMTAQPSGY